jgi:hypothetical protein
MSNYFDDNRGKWFVAPDGTWMRIDRFDVSHDPRNQEPFLIAHWSNPMGEKDFIAVQDLVNHCKPAEESVFGKTM